MTWYTTLPILTPKPIIVRVSILGDVSQKSKNMGLTPSIHEDKVDLNLEIQLPVTIGERMSVATLRPIKNFECCFWLWLW